MSDARQIITDLVLENEQLRQTAGTLQYLVVGLLSKAGGTVDLSKKDLEGLQGAGVETKDAKTRITLRLVKPDTEGTRP